jgi:hypothetical protein
MNDDEKKYYEKISIQYPVSRVMMSGVMMSHDES